MPLSLAEYPLGEIKSQLGLTKGGFEFGFLFRDNFKMKLMSHNWEYLAHEFHFEVISK
jgi:hypothetical protein